MGGVAWRGAWGRQRSASAHARTCQSKRFSIFRSEGPPWKTCVVGSRARRVGGDNYIRLPVYMIMHHINKSLIEGLSLLQIIMQHSNAVISII